MEMIIVSDIYEVKLLENFIYDNEELEKLELLTNDFNIFTALNIINDELKHSNFLAWLLSPRETHNLGDYFLKSLIKTTIYKISKYNNYTIPSIFDIDSWSFDDAEVLREWRNIDIVIRSDENNFVCIIENKVLSKEHSTQSRRYKNIIDREFMDYKYKVFTFLTIDGEEASEEEYISLSYEEIVNIIEKITTSNKDKLGQEIIIFLSHYTEMVRRYIMREAEIQNICERIYKTHKKALDLIYEYKPDNQLEISEVLIDIIKNDSDLILDDSNKKYIRFLPSDLDFIEHEGEGWTKSKRILLFEFRNRPSSLNLYLMIGPGNQDVRERLYNTARKSDFKFTRENKNLSKTWFALHKRRSMKIDEDNYNIEEIKDRLIKYFNKFKNNEMKNIIIAFK
ncbi:MAG: hypothetical protein FH753_03255 [Firmicutes bacterium]|nr:hypothetical protein [Bacillota bacterium]